MKEAPKCWNETFNKFAKKIGFARSKHDVCLYTKQGCIMLLYVDDILLVGENTDDVVSKLKIEFNTKDMGNLSTFLGIEFKHKDNELCYSQKSMINKVLEKFGMTDCKGVNTPLEQGFIITPEDEAHYVDVPFRELIGSLMYISICSRPDITYAVSYLSRYLDKPNNKVWMAGKRVLRYLHETEAMSIMYKRNESVNLIGYSDSDWAADLSDRKSVSGGVIYYCGNPVSWLSKKQHCVTLSSTEAEYVAGSLVCAEMIALKGIATDLSNHDLNTLLYMDNQGAIKISQNHENSKRSKHIDVKYHFLKDAVLQKQLSIKYVDTKTNVADVMTKALGRYIFNEHRKALQLVMLDKFSLRGRIEDQGI